MLHSGRLVTHSPCSGALQVVPNYPYPGASPAADVLMAKSEALDEALKLLPVPSANIVCKSTQCISGTVKSLMGQDTRADAEHQAAVFDARRQQGKPRTNERRQSHQYQKRKQLERDAVMSFLQESSSCDAPADVAEQYENQTATDKQDLSVAFWLTVRVLKDKAEQLQKQYKKEQRQLHKQQKEAQKLQRAQERQRKAQDTQRQQQSGQKRNRRSNAAEAGGNDAVVQDAPTPAAVPLVLTADHIDLTATDEPSTPRAWEAAAPSAGVPCAPKRLRTNQSRALGLPFAGTIELLDD